MIEVIQYIVKPLEAIIGPEVPEPTAFERRSFDSIEAAKALGMLIGERDLEIIAFPGDYPHHARALLEDLETRTALLDEHKKQEMAKFGIVGDK